MKGVASTDGVTATAVIGAPPVDGTPIMTGLVVGEVGITTVGEPPTVGTARTGAIDPDEDAGVVATGTDGILPDDVNPAPLTTALSYPIRTVGRGGNCFASVMSTVNRSSFSAPTGI